MKFEISKDCYILRFLLPDENSSLGANVCQHVFLEAINPNNNNLVKKPYQIISTDKDKGIVDIMIKVYNQKDKNHTDYGFFSNYLSNLEVIEFTFFNFFSSI
jgi:NAD(P)H-flavin reductase